jgi:hypothetical protein
MVVRVGAPSDNELRMMRPPAISGTKARVTGQTSLEAIPSIEKDWRKPQGIIFGKALRSLAES